ncbi:hypothetical protein FB45DRAFT_735694 [Roridomyces roridus]|uniref:NB-ARC domain-containing protein n=1 Tax=Roridomyces roridus TaxID=1738132 RepID=A0AAD7CBY6_9AGAR|nr:hypothetical protein FB45DRAFT_735694 [Roridomyces roridus]
MSSFQNVSNEEVVPSKAMYALQGGHAVAEALESVADVLPVPFLKQFVQVAIKVLEVLRPEATVVEKNVKDLQGRIYHLTLVVVNTVPVGANTSVDLQERIKDTGSLLDEILVDVNKIKEQKKWLLLFFRNINQEVLDRCAERLTVALEQFDVASQLRVEDLLEKIQLDYSTFAAQLNRIEEAVNNSREPHHAPTTFARQDMPPPHRVFLGRDSLVEEIAGLLITESTSRVCITGAGGMGKTSVALAVVRSAVIQAAFPKDYIFWVPCVEAKSADLFRRILYAQLRVTAQSYDSLDPLIAELDTSNKRRLILLDNLETPWFSDYVPDRGKVRDIVGRLAALPNIALLVTMTSGVAPGTAGIQWQHRSLKTLDANSARDAFKSNYRNETGMDEPELDTLLDETHIDALLSSVGRIPLAITLLAVGGGRLRSPPEDMLREWQKTGTAMISVDDMAQCMDNTIKLSMGRVLKSNADALTLLAILSMLPAGTTGHNLGWWAPNIVHLPAIGALRSAALVEQGSGPLASSRIFVRPTIQSYMACNDRISMDVQKQVHAACHRFVLDHKSVPDEAKFKDDLKSLASEETNIQGLLMQIEGQTLGGADAIDALIAFAMYQSWTKPSTVVAERALSVAMSTYTASQAARHSVAILDAAARRVAQAHQCLGKTSLRLDRYDDACLNFEQGRALFKSLPGGADRVRVGECTMDLAETWMYMLGVDESALVSLVEEANADLSHDGDNQYCLARGMLGLGHLRWWQNDDLVALQILSSAKGIFEQLGTSQDNRLSVAQCLRHMARSHAYLEQYDQALVIIKESLANAEQAGDPLLISDNVHSISIHLAVLKLHEEALDMLDRCLPLARAVGNPLGIAQGLELLGYNCAAKRNVKSARLAYDGARDGFSKIHSLVGTQGVRRCSTNFKKLEALNETDSDIFSSLAKPVPLY